VEEGDRAPFLPSPSATGRGRFSLVLAVEKGIPTGATTLEVAAEERVIGRSEQADFRVKLPSISRRHAAVWLVGGAAHVKDLGSQHGTYVNYREINGPTALRPGDRVSLGRDIHFQLVVEEGDEQEAALKQASESDEIDLPPARLAKGLPKLQQPSPSAASPKAESRGYMDVVSKFCTATAKLSSEEELYAAALDSLGELINADRFYFMTGRALETLRVVAERIGKDVEGDVPPSKGIMRRVLYSLSDRPFVTCDAQSEKGIRERSSIVMGNIRSVMCVGLISGGQCEGMVYVDTLGSDMAFGSQDENFLHIIGQIMAARLSNIRQQSELETLQAELKARGGSSKKSGGMKPAELS
jgi:pSer/pThr/pTyr-binding forkhead associated (FHA) protein